MSLTYGPCVRVSARCRSMGVGLVLSVGMALAGADARAAESPPSPAGPSLGALGASIRWSPDYPGASSAGIGLTPNFVLRWGRVTVSNGGPLASRAGEPGEAGLAAELLSHERWRLSASLSLDGGRDSNDHARLRGLHDIPSHLRGRWRLGWRLDPHWEAIAVWRTDLSGRGTGNSLDLTVLHDWRPAFLNHTRWRVSLGTTVDLFDAQRANLIYGVTEEDARRSGLPAYRLPAGLSGVSVFSNAQRELDGGWVAYGNLTASGLMGPASRSPVVQQRAALGVSVGVGKRF